MRQLEGVIYFSPRTASIPAIAMVIAAIPAAIPNSTGLTPCRATTSPAIKWPSGASAAERHGPPRHHATVRWPVQAPASRCRLPGGKVEDQPEADRTANLPRRSTVAPRILIQSAHTSRGRDPEQQKATASGRASGNVAVARAPPSRPSRRACSEEAVRTRLQVKLPQLGVRGQHGDDRPRKRALRTCIRPAQAAQRGMPAQVTRPSQVEPDACFSACVSPSGMPRSARSTARKLTALSAKHAVAATVIGCHFSGNSGFAASASRKNTPAAPPAQPSARS